MTMLTIDAWVDVQCPWCYIGYGRLERAIEESGHAARIRLEPRTFELDPMADPSVEPALARMTGRYGLPLEQARANESELAAVATADGLAYSSDRQMSSSRDPLRLVHLAKEHCVGWRFARAVQREIFSGNAEAFGHETLTRLGVDLGIPAAAISGTLAGDGYADQLKVDREEARRLGARGVPFTVFGDQVVVQGGSTVPDYIAAIERSSHAARPAVVDGIQCAVRSGTGSEA
ncbi:DsbA family oxidoreductase [Actinophytocola gossypii]|uniref:DsbA family oxidoreductase n=1 Tax=Actinophytocola gossypii TaxID=2812003 RepID=A0ABT2J605_9PSEU|nr:DsbA family oxidoreductase [Actinophytocola gossypii]MCT2582925.1 DsbA family oxidoreductase [Actinophytocola gossypii]